MALLGASISRALMPEPPCPRRSPRLARLHSPQQAHENFCLDEAERPGNKRTVHAAKDSPRRRGNKEPPAPEEAIVPGEAPGRAAEDGMAGARPRGRRTTPPPCEVEGCTSHTCTWCHRSFRRHDYLRRHVHSRHAGDTSGPPPARDEADASKEKCTEACRRLRPRATVAATWSRRPPRSPFKRLGPEDGEAIRQEEAEGERYYLSRHATGVGSQDELQKGGSEPATFPVAVCTARACKPGRVETAWKRPSHYNRDWISKKELDERGLWYRRMFQDMWRHVHDQVYFTNEAGNKMWLVDDEGQAVLAQDQTL